ncbi:hypothetical protein H2279_08585, partial [Campylobacter sp. B0100352/1]|nr:hypothetical protein [Campylobacter sp. B0100352/1]
GAETTKITIDGANNTLTIEEGGSVKPSSGFAVEFQANSSLKTFENKGTLLGASEAIKFKGTTIDNFINSGTIDSQNWSGLEINNGTNYIKTFNNTGTINSNKNNAIFLYQGGIDEFINEKDGLIKGNDHGIKIDHSTIKTFNNEGIISNNNDTSLKIDSSAIETLNNSGTIKSDGVNEPSDSSSIIGSTGIKIYLTHAKNFNNTGVVAGKVGVSLGGSTIDSFTNSGTIESMSNHKYGAAIAVSNLNGIVSTIKNFTNSGTIKADNASGILIEAGNTIENLTNSGTIEASLYGIGFFTVDKYGNEIN